MVEKSNEEQKERVIYANKNVITLIYFIIVLAIISIIIIHYDLIRKLETNYIKSGLAVENIILENEKINITLKPSLIKKDRWCQVLKENETPKKENWIKVNENSCILDITSDSKYIVVKDEKNQSKTIPISNYLNSIFSINVEKEKFILVLGEEKEIKTNIQCIGMPDTTLICIPKNEEILKVNGNKIEGIGVGETTLKISDKYNYEINIQVVVTDLITMPELTPQKEFLTAEKYTEEEAHLLDEILEERVNEAGLKTRAGVVAAARFMTLEFKHKVPYFLENGRYQKTGFSEAIDGEGRFYHKGLYLSEDKYETIKSSKRKPAMWGETLYEYSTSRYMKNGLDCSGFVTWALYNGGYDPGDIGAGPGEWYTTLPDLGKSQVITLNLLKSGQVKAGDLIGWDGHIGLIIGIDENNIYTADTIYYKDGLVAKKYTFEEFVNKSGFTHIYDMSDYYIEDGNYTNMW